MGLQIRKAYLKTRLFLYTYRRVINMVVYLSLITVVFYMFINSFIFGRIILNSAYADKAEKQYIKAISLFDVAIGYYKLNHFAESNKKIYFDILYQRASCYLESGKVRKSLQLMDDATDSLDKQYGVNSKENAFFIRKYLINYYLSIGDINQAMDEFKLLIKIHKKIGYTDSVMADLLRIRGDIYYKKGQIDNAMGLYTQAYQALLKSKDIDYSVFSKLVNRINDYQIQNSRFEEASNIFKSSISILKNAGAENQNFTADMLIVYANFLIKRDDVKNAIIAYEEAIYIIKRLPSTSHQKQNIYTYLSTLKELYNEDGQYLRSRQVDVEQAQMRRFVF